MATASSLLIRESGPVDGRLPRLLQQLVGLGEVLAVEEAPVGGERGGVDGLQNVMPLLVGKRGKR